MDFYYTTLPMSQILYSIYLFLSFHRIYDVEI